MDVATGRHRRLRAVGAFDMSNRDILAAAIHAVTTDGPDRIEIDVREVRFIDAGVVRILLRHRTSPADTGCTLRIVGATGLPAMVLDLTSTHADLCGPQRFAQDWLTGLTRAGSGRSTRPGRTRAAPRTPPTRSG